MYKLFLFPSPPEARCTIQTDSGYEISGVPDTHFSGRPGQSLILPYGHNNMNGAYLSIEAPGMVPVRVRGILMLNDTGVPWPFDPRQEAAFAPDDFHLTAETICPPVTPVPTPNPEPDPGPGPTDPETIGEEVYRTGLFNLRTKEGCGEYTEAVCVQLHERHSKAWGHVKKTGAQNSWPPQDHGNPDLVRHAVDALNFLGDPERPEFEEGVYDIIFSTESDEAEPTMNRVGPANRDLWLDPADVH